MTRLYIPPSLRYFDAVRDAPATAGQPTEHAALLYDVVEGVRPGLLADFGAGSARAFTAACQSLRDHDVDGLAYAVDAWADDPDEPDGDAARSDSINNFLHAHFRGIAYLLKVAPRDALRHFAERSIGVLRIDASRIGEPLGPFLDSCLPLLADDGVLLCAGVVGNPDAEADFLARCGPSALIFPGGEGLGVSVAPTRVSRRMPASPLLALLSSDDVEERRDLVRFYAHVDEHLALRERISGHRGELVRKKGRG